MLDTSLKGQFLNALEKNASPMAIKDISEKVLVLFKTNSDNQAIILGLEKESQNTIKLTYQLIKLPEHNILEIKDIHLDEKIQSSEIVDSVILENVLQGEILTAYMVKNGLEVEIGSSMPTLRVSARQDSPSGGPPTINSIIFTVLPVPDSLKHLIGNPQDRVIIALRRI